MRATLASVVERHDVIVCAGSGGVGKTTTAATIALWGARRGRRAAVLTIDPARRLADSLGVQLSGGEGTSVSAEVLREHGIELSGSLTAMMLDQKSAWDSLIERHAPSPEVRERILENRFYQHLSQSFAGSQEYMAVEELSRLRDSGRYDLIVVDTPPSRHALEFLEAPQRLSDFLDRRIVRWFVKPYVSAGWSAMRLVNRTAGFVLRTLEEATGVAVLTEISDFFAGMQGLFEGFAERTERVYHVLKSPKTAFVLVSSPEEEVLEEAEYLSDKMAALGMPLRAVVFNRVHEEFTAPIDRADFPRGDIRGGDQERVAACLTRSGLWPPGLVERLAANFVAYQDVARGDAMRLELFTAGLRRQVPIVRVPNFSTDLHDLGGLARLHPYLFDRSESR
ncbi:MAG: ArsA-related P-loop ATPase [Candidatus Binatia bacterium]